MMTGDLHRDRGPILFMDISNLWCKIPEVKLTEFSEENQSLATKYAGQRERKSDLHIFQCVGLKLHHVVEDEYLPSSQS